MISKDALTRSLRDASDLEEGIMGFLTRYVDRHFDWSGFPPDRIAEVKRMIHKIVLDSSEHKRLVEELLEWISGRRENEF